MTDRTIGYTPGLCAAATAAADPKEIPLTHTSIISANPEFGSSFRPGESRPGLLCHYMHCLRNLVAFCLYTALFASKCSVKSRILLVGPAMSQHSPYYSWHFVGQRQGGDIYRTPLEQVGDQVPVHGQTVFTYHSTVFCE